MTQPCVQRRVMLGFALSLTLFSGCAAGSALQGADSPRATEQGSAPDFQLETLEGNSFRLAEHLGKRVVLLDFWATWCDPCKASMPHLEELYQRHKKDGLVVVGVSIDGPQSRAQVRSEASRLGVTFPIVLDEESAVVGLYNPRASAPYSVLIDRAGNVVARREGYRSGDMATLENQIRRAVTP